MALMNEEILATFVRLLQEARTAGEPEAIAMNLATCDAQGRLSSRVVLMKEVDAEGFVFYTNCDSRKAAQMAANPNVALCFHWKHLRNGVQVRVEGAVEAVNAAQADAYFASRPRGSQIGAWASKQSETMQSRDEFDQRIAAFESKFDGMQVPRPDNWSGYRVKPVRIEFWYGAEFRLHDRDLYEWIDGVWQKRLLFP